MKCVICKRDRGDVVSASVLFGKNSSQTYGKFVCRRCLFAYTCKLVFSSSNFSIVNKKILAVCEKYGAKYEKTIVLIARRASRVCSVNVFMAHEAMERGWEWFSAFSRACDKIVGQIFPAAEEESQKNSKKASFAYLFQKDPKIKYACTGLGYTYALACGQIFQLGTIHTPGGNIVVSWNKIPKCPVPTAAFVPYTPEIDGYVSSYWGGLIDMNGSPTDSTNSHNYIPVHIQLHNTKKANKKSTFESLSDTVTGVEQGYIEENVGIPCNTVPIMGWDESIVAELSGYGYTFIHPEIDAKIIVTENEIHGYMIHRFGIKVGIRIIQGNSCVYKKQQSGNYMFVGCANGWASPSRIHECLKNTTHLEVFESSCKAVKEDGTKCEHHIDTGGWLV